LESTNQLEASKDRCGVPGGEIQLHLNFPDDLIIIANSGESVSGIVGIELHL
jgi:hypothetical protein